VLLAPLLLSVASDPHITLMAVGDVMLDRYVGRAIEREGMGYPLGAVGAILQKADLVVANLECPLTRHPKQLVKQFVFRAPPARVAALKGIDLVSVANNHSLDCGRTGLAATLSTLKAAKIEVCGSNLEPTIVVRKGIRLAFLGFSDFPEPGGGVNYYEPALLDAVRGARRKADIVVVFPHWGVEGRASPSERQVGEAKELAQAGADLVIGSHPHTLQPISHIGHTVVAYSMGNFVFDSQGAPTAIFDFTISRRGVESAKLIMCRIVGSRPIPAP
jgi:poly-gamma-glutamate capsule biosynthesis protein CapA/YwtB (metallophosphatase superfamily)